MSAELNLDNLEPVKRFMDELKELYPAPWHYHEVRIQAPDGKEYIIFPPEGRADTITVLCEETGHAEWFHHLDEVCEYLRKIGIARLPSVEH
ncbi:MAG: hypothetical protein DRI92_00305 [Aquificota bacterium]|nr:MAG: hypothetical protein DRI92_00305 [Aquificota bacterium]